MSHGLSSNSKNGSSKRPSSIAELAERAMLDVWDDSKDFKFYLRVAERHRREGKEYMKRGDTEGAFVELARAATLVLEKLPRHRDYDVILTPNQRHNLALNGQDILDNLSELKKRIVERYEKWMQRHPEEYDHETTPNARVQSISSEEARAAAEERERNLEREERETRDQQRRAAEEAIKWRQQREQLHASEAAESARQQEVIAHQESAQKPATVPRGPLPPQPDYTFQRTPMQNNGYGTQNTVVISDGRPTDEVIRQQQQREDEIAKRKIEERRQLEERWQIEGRRREEQEGTARRQKEAEEVARSMLQNNPPQPLPPSLQSHKPPAYVASPSTTSFTTVSPMFPKYPTSSAGTTPQKPSHIEYPSIQSRLAPSSAIQPAFPRVMPLETPNEGDSTDSESIHRDFRKRYEVRTPTRNVRSPVLYPPPITTTSTLPDGAGTIRYPALMSPHQKEQGYFPSLNSIFIDSIDRHHGTHSVLFGSNGPNSHPSIQSAPAQAPYPYSNSHGGSGYSRPLPPNPRATLPTTAAEVARMPIPPDAIFDPNIPLKVVSLPRDTLPRFLAIAKVNTEMNRETCGLLLGKDKGSKYSVTTLLIPKQHSTSDTCTMDEEELVLQFTEERGLITLGWIHTHPSQSCFMSSVDLHTHSAFQRMLPESFAVVCAPKSSPNFGIFRLTDPPGLNIILNCDAKEAFHPHPDEPIYTDADKGHVQMKDAALEIVDLR